MAEIQSRLAYVSCVRQLEQVKKAPYCRYIRPPIDKYQTLDFGLFDEIADMGLQYGRQLVREWEAGGRLDELRRPRHRHQRQPLPRMALVPAVVTSSASFTDLAALVTTIARPSQLLTRVSEEREDDDDDDDDYEDEEGEEEDGNGDVVDDREDGTGPGIQIDSGSTTDTGTETEEEDAKGL